MKVYVSLPMAGHPKLNEPLARIAEDRLTKMGYEPVIPHDCEPINHPGPCPWTPDYRASSTGKHTSAYCCLKGDIAYMMTCDKVMFLPGWEKSRGCRTEREVARLLRIPILDIDEDTIDQWRRETNASELG